MKIVMTGGGSGGHITPILAVAHELKRLQPATEIIYIGQTGDPLADIPAADPNIDAVYSVSAGKFRRYSGEGWRQFLDVHTQFLNARDGFRILLGLWQSFRLLRNIKPNVVFSRGGFVSVPVTLGGKLNAIPYITHDSDSMPSLANRLISRWASQHAVALPAELYPYPKEKTVVVGVPVSQEYVRVTLAQQRKYRQLINVTADSHVLFVTGGGNGARHLNEAIVANARYMLASDSSLLILHVAGRGLEAETNAAYDALTLGAARKRVKVFGFIQNLQRYSGAADVIVARGGATNLAEFAIQGKACVIIPAPHLTGGHQVANSKVLAERQAIMQLSEQQIDQPERLGRTITGLLDDNAARMALGNSLHELAQPDAAEKLAQVIITVGDQKRAAQKK